MPRRDEREEDAPLLPADTSDHHRHHDDDDDDDDLQPPPPPFTSGDTRDSRAAPPPPPPPSASGDTRGGADAEAEGEAPPAYDAPTWFNPRVIGDEIPAHLLVGAAPPRDVREKEGRRKGERKRERMEKERQKEKAFHSCVPP